MWASNNNFSLDCSRFMKSIWFVIFELFFHKIIWYTACHSFTGQINKVIIYFDCFIGYVVVLTVVNFFWQTLHVRFFFSTVIVWCLRFLCKIKKLEIELVASFISTEVKQLVVTNCSKERPGSVVTKTLKKGSLIPIPTSKESHFNTDVKYISFIKFSLIHQKLRAWENLRYYRK